MDLCKICQVKKFTYGTEKCTSNHRFHVDCIKENRRNLNKYCLECKDCMELFSGCKSDGYCLICNKNIEPGNCCKKLINFCIDCAMSHLFRVEKYADHFIECNKCMHFFNRFKKCSNCMLPKNDSELFSTPRCKFHHFCKPCLNEKSWKELRCHECAMYYKNRNRIGDGINCNSCGLVSPRPDCDYQHSYCDKCKSFFIGVDYTAYYIITRCPSCPKIFKQLSETRKNISHSEHNQSTLKTEEEKNIWVNHQEVNKVAQETNVRQYIIHENDMSYQYRGYSNPYDQKIVIHKVQQPPYVDYSDNPKQYGLGTPYQENPSEYNNANLNPLSPRGDTQFYQPSNLNIEFSNPLNFYNQSIPNDINISTMVPNAPNPQDFRNNISSISYPVNSFTEEAKPVCDNCKMQLSVVKLKCLHNLCKDCEVFRAAYLLLLFRESLFKNQSNELKQSFVYSCYCGYKVRISTEYVWSHIKIYKKNNRNDNYLTEFNNFIENLNFFEKFLPYFDGIPAFFDRCECGWIRMKIGDITRCSGNH